MRGRLAVAGSALALLLTYPGHGGAQADAPVVTVDTSRGTFSFETFPNEAPMTVAHIASLVRTGFYDGQRIVRAVPGFVVQFGDPQSREVSQRALWGRGGGAASGKPVGVAELTKRRRHVQGAVGLAHMGDPSKGDSQIYVTLAPRPDLDGQYVVFGHLLTGAEVVASLEVGDLIVRASVSP
jgi:peptidyl-prolyl cis-trans isomerase B (cyclophilin B)